jgi:ERCC4-type nuclease
MYNKRLMDQVASLRAMFTKPVILVEEEVGNKRAATNPYVNLYRNTLLLD